jgi:hypothetical protein
MEESFFSTYHSSFMVFWWLLVHFAFWPYFASWWGGGVFPHNNHPQGARTLALLHFSSTNVGLSCPFHFSEKCFFVLDVFKQGSEFDFGFFNNLHSAKCNSRCGLGVVWIMRLSLKLARAY